MYAIYIGNTNKSVKIDDISAKRCMKFGTSLYIATDKRTKNDIIMVKNKHAKQETLATFLFDTPGTKRTRKNKMIKNGVYDFTLENFNNVKYRKSPPTVS